MERDEFLTVDEAAALLQMSKGWIYRSARQGKIPARKIGHYVRIPKEELRRWIDAQVVHGD